MDSVDAGIGDRVLAMALPVVSLAKGTSTILLTVYAVVNLSLWRIQWRERREGVRIATSDEGPRYPIWLPIVGCIACVSFVAFEAFSVVSSLIVSSPQG